MANTFYRDACEMDTKMSPFAQDVNTTPIVDDKDDASKLTFHYGKNAKLYGPHSIMNDHVAINYRTIYNGFGLQESVLEGNTKEFTEYSDYLRCVSKENYYKKFLEDKKNPTYIKILDYYNESFDPSGLSRYKMQDFIYLKYFNQIPNNYMLTLRRYARPCDDHMFGLDLSPAIINAMHNYPESYCAIATAVTYMGEQTGNKLSDILKFDYGANWEDKTAEVQSLQSSDSGLAGQLKQRANINGDLISGTMGGNLINSSNAKMGLLFSAMTQGKGVSVHDAMASQQQYDGNEFERRYGNQFYGDLNVVQNVKMRSRGLTFSNNFSLTFEYSLKSLKTVNPRIAMLDILTNFLILTGNYGQFWGGATIFYGAKNIASQYGDPSLLRKGDYGAYMQSLWRDVKQGFNMLGKNADGTDNANVLEKLLNVAGNIIKGGATALIGNIFGGKIGVAGESQVPAAMLTGNPSGYWHLTVGNPLDPIAMMGNMAVTKTTVQFSDVLGYDDFPTEIKFTVDMEHCRPRDNAFIESMFNGGKGRFYAFTNGELEKAYHTVDMTSNFQNGNTGGTQEAQNLRNLKEGDMTHSPQRYEQLKVIGGILNH